MQRVVFKLTELGTIFLEIASEIDTKEIVLEDGYRNAAERYTFIFQKLIN